jgi:hypothetical protein
MGTINPLLARAIMTSSKRVAMPTTVPTNNHMTEAVRKTTIDTTTISRILDKRSAQRHSRPIIVKRDRVKVARTRKTWAIDLMMPDTSRELLHKRRNKGIQDHRDGPKVSRCLLHGIMQRGQQIKMT